MIDPITPEEERAILKDWFETVQFDEESDGIPALDPEPDDEERSSVDAAAIVRWFKHGATGRVPGSTLDFRYAHSNPGAWSKVDASQLGMSVVAAKEIISREADFQELFGDNARYNKYHSNKDGKFTSNPGGGAAKLAKKAVDKIGKDGGGKDGKDGGKNKDDDLIKDPAIRERAKKVESTIGSARKTIATELTETLPGGAWKPERDRIHRDIANELYSKAANVPNDGKVVIAGGLGGAGKTTVLTKHANIDTSNYLTLNPDDVKEVMAKRGLVPDVPGAPELSPMERAALIHEESSRITQMVAAMAYRDKKNVIWDITMSSQKSVQSRLDALKKNGYSEFKGVFVDIPVEVSVSRAMSRYERGAQDYLKGKGEGGRYVPPAIIRAQKTSSGVTVNREVFDGMRDQFNDWAVYDNSVTGRAPELVAKAGAK